MGHRLDNLDRKKLRNAHMAFVSEINAGTTHAIDSMPISWHRIIHKWDGAQGSHMRVTVDRLAESGKG